MVVGVGGTDAVVVSAGIAVVVEGTDCPGIPEALVETVIVSEAVMEARVSSECQLKALVVLAMVAKCSVLRA